MRLIWLDPIRFVHTCHRRYGDRLTIRVPGIGTLVFLTDPDDIRSVARGDPAIFHAGESAAPLGEVLGTKSLVMLDGDKHRRSRVIGVHDEGRLAALRAALPPMLEIGSPLALIPPPPVLRRFGMWRRRAQRNAAAQALLADEITRCRADPQRLTRHPALLERTAQAACDGDDAWLDAVCKETPRCLGATFAQVEMRTVLREVFRRVELSLTTAPDEPVKPRQVTMVPRQAARVTVRRHLPAADRVA
ncbi:MAG: hypothetical protein ACRDRR_08690 [Pseudonocardiaceae bacterium]